MKKLDGLTAEMTYVGDLHLGCLKGSLDYLGIPVTRPWLAGVTGQAFVIAIAPGICLSSVSSWRGWAATLGTSWNTTASKGWTPASAPRRGIAFARR